MVEGQSPSNRSRDRTRYMLGPGSVAKLSMLNWATSPNHPLLLETSATRIKILSIYLRNHDEISMLGSTTIGRLSNHKTVYLGNFVLPKLRT